jgi:hypothetical protein
MGIEAIMMQNLKLHEDVKVIGEWMRTITTKEDNETNMAKRISSRNIFDKPGSATEDEALAMLKRKKDSREATNANAAAKKCQVKDKRAIYTTTFVTTSSEVVKRLEQLGPSKLLHLTIDKLYALLVNNDPLGSISKPKKKTWQEKANLMPIIQAAFRRYLAVAAVSAPSMLPNPVVLVIYEGENIINSQIEGQTELLLPISDPVFPYVTHALADAEVIVAYA